MGYKNNAGKGMLSFPSGADLSAVTNRGRFVKNSGAGTLVLCGVGGAGAIGVLEDGGSASGSICTMAPLDGRIVEVRLGATLNAGDEITSDANGKAKAVVANTTNTSDAGAAADPLLGSNVLGFLLQGGVDGDLVSAFVQNVGARPSTAS